MKHKTFNIRHSVSRDRKTFNLILEGDLGLRNSSAIWNSLRTMELSGDEIILNLQRIDKIDITTVQGIISFCRHLENNGKSAKVIADLPQDTQRLLTNSGFKSTLIQS